MNKENVLKQAKKILGKSLKGYHILSSDNIYFNITNGNNSFSGKLDTDGNIEYINQLGN